MAGAVGELGLERVECPRVLFAAGIGRADVLLLEAGAAIAGCGGGLTEFSFTRAIDGVRSAVDRFWTIGTGSVISWAGWGGAWIDNQIQKQHIPLTDKCLDFYHLKDNIQKTRREIFGDDEAGKAWAHDLAQTFKTEGFTAGFDSLITFRKTVKGTRRRTAINRLVEYISDRRALISYPEFQAAGRDIGSGPTEAQCKCETLRIKGHGRRWNTDNALAISTIEAMHQSRLTDKFWNLTRPKQLTTP